MSTVGQIERFDESSEDWQTYAERLSFYFEANDISTAKKVPALLSLIGGKTYALLRNLISPDSLASKTYDELVTVLQDHFHPKPLIIGERFRFHRCNQQEGETAQEYLATLKKLAQHCDFGANLNDTLRDRFVCGLRNDIIRHRLLIETGLTIHKAIEISVGIETAAKDSSELQADMARRLGPVNMLQTSQDKMNASKSKPVVSSTPPRFHKRNSHFSCWRCGNSGHAHFQCKFKTETCRTCGKEGHIQRVCRDRNKSFGHKNSNNPRKTKSDYKQRPLQQIRILEDDDSNDDLGLYSFKTDESAAFVVQLQVQGKLLKMELDTGAAVSVISSNDYGKYFPHISLQAANIHLTTYTGERLRPQGMMDVEVRYKTQVHNLQLYVVDRGGPPLMGRSWLQHIKLDWHNLRGGVLNKQGEMGIHHLSNIVQRHKDVFTEELGTLRGKTAKLFMKEGTRPKFVKARPVPFALKHKVERELDRLEKIGVISPIEHCDWATPVVPVVKKDGSIRLCGDYKVTVNPNLQPEQYPLPKIDEMYATLSGGKRFSKLDLSQAYQQMQVDAETSKLLCLNTHKGLYQVHRLAFGISSAAAIFQRAMEQVLQGLEGVLVYQDDILVTGCDDESHLQNLELVLTRLEENGIRLKKQKCAFFMKSIEYLGHTIDADGLHPSDSKVEAIRDAPIPQNITQLRSFLGLVNYYGKFLPNLATVLRPLHSLLEQDSEWIWTQKQEESFTNIKKMLLSSKVLVHFNPDLPLTLSCDASAYGIGAVISHISESGQERPIAFASRTLNKAERGYAQIEKEALSIVYGIKKFHQYLFGKKFTLITDHLPLVKIFGATNSIPAMAAARLQRWALILAAHSYDIRYKSSKDHGNADGLSRLPLSVSTPETEDSADIFNITQIEEILPVDHSMIRSKTETDAILSEVYRFTRGGWPDIFSEELRPYHSRRHELTIQQGSLLWGSRVIIPNCLRSRVLREIHSVHSGVVRMKAIARSFVWWPGIDNQIELTAKECGECNNQQNMPTKAPLHPWIFPDRPWERVHIDYAGPFLGHMFLIVVDAYTKWPEVVVTSSTTADATIDILREIFARFGLPNQVVTDNGPQFTADSFEWFMKLNGVRHIRSAPYHPATNGLAERMVQTVKNSLKGKLKGRSIKHALADFLLVYRSTPHATTHETPANLMFRRNIRTRLDLLRPNIDNVVRDAQQKQVEYRNMHAKDRNFDDGDDIYARNYSGSDKWVKGKILQQTGPVSYQVEVAPGVCWKRHQDQIVQATVENKAREPTGLDTTLKEQPEDEPQAMDTTEQNAKTNLSKPTPQDDCLKRYPTRVRRPPRRFDV